MLYKLPLTVRLMTLYPLMFLMVGLSAFFAQYLYHSPTPAAAAGPVAAVAPAVLKNDQVLSGEPATLVIPRLKINLPIELGYYNPAGNSWTLGDGEAFYATSTHQASNQPGNTLIYGHNRSSALEPTRDLVVGDMLQVVTKNGLTFTYAYTGDSVVDPTDISVLTRAYASPHLTLLTCKGLWSQQRRLMDFELTSVQ